MLNFIRAILCFLRFDKMYFKSGLKSAGLGDVECTLGAFAYEELSPSGKLFRSANERLVDLLPNYWHQLEE